MELILAGESRPDTTDLNIKTDLNITTTTKRKSQEVGMPAQEPCLETAGAMADLPAELVPASSSGIKPMGREGERKQGLWQVGADSREPGTRSGFSEPWSAQLYSRMVRQKPATQRNVSTPRTAQPGMAPFADTLNRYGPNTH